MQTRRTRRTRSQWQAIIEHQAGSGEPARSWCQANDVGYVSFMKWRKELTNDAPSHVNEPTFVELTEPLSPSAFSSPWLVELDLAAGVQLRIARLA